MSRVAVIFLLVSLVYCNRAMATNAPAALFSKAGAAYKAQNFEEAAKLYESLIAANKRNADVYYNLANCYYKLNLLGKSIVNYERALALAPDDEDIIHNLKLAQLKTIDRVQSVPQMGFVTKWKNFLHLQSAGSWSIIALAFLWLSLVCTALYLFIFSTKKPKAIGYSSLFLSFTFLLLAVARNQEQQNTNQAVLIAENSSIKSAPDDNANNLFVIHEGLKIQLLDQVGPWYKIRLTDGKVGWLQKEAFERI
ncbi:MAG: tetratricopeptide repeat protein [Bacteroidetes bacterium]|nr:tetratricopeptide repeat protein [Bacteroidota bacterium]